jgi:hypothetical protein
VLFKNSFKEERVSAGEPKERVKHAQDTANKVRPGLASPSKSTPSTTRKFSVNDAFKEAGELVKSGVMSPSRFALRDWCKREYGELPSDKDIALWQSNWLKAGLIEQYQLPNRKQSYRLRVLGEKPRKHRGIDEVYLNVTLK